MSTELLADWFDGTLTTLHCEPAGRWRNTARSSERTWHESLALVATETEVGELLHQRGWRTAFTVAERVNAWALLVTAIERGYSDDIDEYTNDLYCRNWLHEAWLLLDEHTIQLWTPQIKALDNRYKATTVDDDGQALDKFHKLPGPDLWWWRRHPRILTEDLGRSLRAVDWLAFAVWRNGVLVRSLSVSREHGVMEDIGERLPFEAPYWDGLHPVEPIPGRPGQEPYPLPFHPLELGEGALRALFGFIIEGRPEPDDVDADDIPLHRFRLTDPDGPTPEARQAALEALLARMNPPRTFRLEGGSPIGSGLP